MDKLTTIKYLLAEIGLPKAQQRDLCAYVVLAMANIAPKTPFTKATNQWMRIHDIIVFTGSKYGRQYAENSRETFRKVATSVLPKTLLGKRKYGLQTCQIT